MACCSMANTLVSFLPLGRRTMPWYTMPFFFETSLRTPSTYTVSLPIFFFAFAASSTSFATFMSMLISWLGVSFHAPLLHHASLIDCIPGMVRLLISLLHGWG